MRVERILWRTFRAKNMTCETPLKQWVTLPGCDVVSGMSRELCRRRGEECVEETSVESEAERPTERKQSGTDVYYIHINIY